MSLGSARGGPRIVTDDDLGCRLERLAAALAQWLRRLVRGEHPPMWEPSGMEKEEDRAMAHRAYGWDEHYQEHGDNDGDQGASKPQRVYRPFAEARAYARSLDLKDMKEWFAWARSGQRPTDVPQSPEQVYKDHGWGGYGDWLRGQ
jgi:hypothetical protein